MDKPQRNHSEMNVEEVPVSQKEKWNPPVIVPLDTKLTEFHPGHGFDGETIWTDSTAS